MNLITLNCATCHLDAEAADTRLHNDEVECGTCRMKRHRLEHYAYVESLAREDAAAEKRTVRYQQRVGSILPGGLMRWQAS